MDVYVPTESVSRTGLDEQISRLPAEDYETFSIELPAEFSISGGSKRYELCEYSGHGIPSCPVD